MKEGKGDCGSTSLGNILAKLFDLTLKLKIN